MPVGPEPMSCCGSRGGRGAGLGSWRWDEASGLRFVGCHPGVSTVLPGGLDGRATRMVVGALGGRSRTGVAGRRCRPLAPELWSLVPGHRRPVVPGNVRHGTLRPVFGFPDAVARTRECGAYSSRMMVGMSRQRIAESCRFPQPAVMAVAVEKARYVHRAPTAHRGDTSARPRTNARKVKPNRKKRRHVRATQDERTAPRTTCRHNLNMTESRGFATGTNNVYRPAPGPPVRPPSWACRASRFRVPCLKPAGLRSR